MAVLATCLVHASAVPCLACVGRWTEEEEQRLRAAVERDLANKALVDRAVARATAGGNGQEEEDEDGDEEAGGRQALGAVGLPQVQSRARGGRVLDSVNWVAVAQAVGTRSTQQCMEKW